MEGGITMDRFFSFDKMLTPTIIKILFWIGLVFVGLTGLVFIISGLNTYAGGFITLSGIGILVVGPIFVKVYCELLIVMFKMHETLVEIRDELRQSKQQRIS